jgi:hypothetical protein
VWDEAVPVEVKIAAGSAPLTACGRRLAQAGYLLTRPSAG